MALLAPKPLPDRNDADIVSALDAIVEKTWQEQRLLPARDVFDLEYLRRASLDVIGRVPTRQEIDQLEKDEAPDRRARLLDRLLFAGDFAQYWAAMWTEWLLVPLAPPDPQVTETGGDNIWLRPAPVLPRRHWDELRAWFEARLFENERGLDAIVRRLLAAGGDQDRGAVPFLFFHAGETFLPSEVAKQGHCDMIPATRQIVRLFLGYRMEGLPLEDKSADGAWTPADFWGVNAFLRQTQRIGSAEKKDAEIDLRDDPKAHASGSIAFKTLSGATGSAKLRFLDGRVPEADAKGTRRALLGEMIVAHANFARAIVSRVWAQFFGHGLQEHREVDDFGKHHKLRHPALLERLSREFVRAGYDLRRLVRWICSTKAYQRAPIAVDSGRIAESERFFSHMTPRPLNYYQVSESLYRILTPEKNRRRAEGWEELREGVRRHWMPNDPTRKDERHTHGEMGAALFLQNDPDLNALIHERAQDVCGLTFESPEALWKHLFLVTLSRHATKKELAKIKEDVKPILIKEKNSVAPVEDVLWALLQSSEFKLNH